MGVAPPLAEPDSITLASPPDVVTVAAPCQTPGAGAVIVTEGGAASRPASRVPPAGRGVVNGPPAVVSSWMVSGAVPTLVTVTGCDADWPTAWAPKSIDVGLTARLGEGGWIATLAMAWRTVRPPVAAVNASNAWFGTVTAWSSAGAPS